MLAGESLPDAEYQVDGATAGVRNMDGPGSGDFPARQPRRAASLRAYLDGHGLYSDTPTP